MENRNIVRILNNTYSEKAVGEAITNIQLSNYNYLYQLQNDLVDYHRFEFRVSDVKRDYRVHYDDLKNKFYLKVPKEFITPGMKSRFKRSRYYNKLLSIFDIEDNSLFHYNCLVFIGGRLFTGFKIFPTDECTYIAFDNNKFTTTGTTDPATPITVIVAPNFDIVSEETNTYRLVRGIPVNPEYYKTRSSKYQYIHTLTADNMVSDIMLTTKKDGALLFASEIPEHYYGKMLQSNSIGFKHLAGTVIVRNQTYFSITRRNMPIVGDKMLIFKKTTSGLIFQHDMSIVSLYPNIYKLNKIESNVEYYIIYFYYKDTIDFESDALIYDDKFSLLDRVGFDLLNSYRSNSIPNVVKNYVPEVFNYSIKDFEESGKESRVDYKDDKLISLIETDSTNAYKYFEQQIEYPFRVYLDVINVNLDSRIRTTTQKETPKQVVNFRKPHYVFALKKSILEDPLNTRIYIDGRIQVFHTITENDFNIYIYIPCEFVDMFSMIEFESFKSVQVEKSFTINNREAVIDMSDLEMQINHNDILILDKNNDVIGPEYYDIKIHLKDALYISLSDLYNTSLGTKIKVIFNSDRFNGGTFKIRIVHPSMYIKQEIVTDDDRGKAIYVNVPVDRDVDHFRIYKNGLLIPREHYDIKYRQNADSMLGVDILLNKKVGDVIVVDISPIKYKEVMKINLIPFTGYINTAGILNKPFSLKWYDVYLNGKKLNAGNIDVISPTKFFIYNVETRRNLVIVESNRDEEYFGITESHRSYNDVLWDEYPDLADDLIMMNGFIFDSEEDVLTEPVHPMSVDMDRFYEYYAKHQPILDPDEETIPDEIWNQFELLQSDDAILIDPDINPDAPSILEFLDYDEE